MMVIWGPANSSGARSGEAPCFPLRTPAFFLRCMNDVDKGLHFRVQCADLPEPAIADAGKLISSRKGESVHARSAAASPFAD